MDDDVPLSIVLREIFDVPPILVELSVAEPYDLCEYVHPGVENAIEQDEQAYHPADCREDYRRYELAQTARVLGSVLEDGDTHGLEHDPHEEDQN